MKKQLLPFIMFVSYLLVAGLFTYVGYRWAYTPPVQPEIVEIIKYKTVYKEKATTCEKLLECYQSPIVLDIRKDDTVMHVVASDSCKATAADVKLACPEKSDWKGRVLFGVGGLLTGVAATALFIIAL